MPEVGVTLGMLLVYHSALIVVVIGWHARDWSRAEVQAQITPVFGYGPSTPTIEESWHGAALAYGSSPVNRSAGRSLKAFSCGSCRVPARSLDLVSLSECSPR
jgi:hypothetical protein